MENVLLKDIYDVSVYIPMEEIINKVVGSNDFRLFGMDKETIMALKVAYDKVGGIHPMSVCSVEKVFLNLMPGVHKISLSAEDTDCKRIVTGPITKGDLDYIAEKAAEVVLDRFWNGPIPKRGE